MTLKLHNPEFILPSVPRVWLPYNEYKACDGDALLWEPTSAWGPLICAETGGLFCHASGVVRVFGRPCQAAYEEGRNGFLSPLSGEVRRFSGKISVFRPFDPELGVPFGEDMRARVAFELFNALGGDYAWSAIQLIYEQRSPLWRSLRWMFPPLQKRFEARVAETSGRKTSAICSQALARAWLEAADVYLADEKLPLALVSPNDIARGCACAYIGTLTWPEAWKHGGPKTPTPPTIKAA